MYNDTELHPKLAIAKFGVQRVVGLSRGGREV
jgi:hypothetical protein